MEGQCRKGVIGVTKVLLLAPVAKPHRALAAKQPFCEQLVQTAEECTPLTQTSRRKNVSRYPGVD